MSGNDDDEKAYLDELRYLPIAVDKVLALKPDIEKWAQHFANKHHTLFWAVGGITLLI